jgi:hypothetical protein
MWKILSAIVLIFVGAVIGVYMANASVTAGSNSKTFIHNGSWRTSLYVGATDADPHIRAYVAAIGLLGLSRQEAIYFQAYSDDEGNPLSSDHVYELIAGDLPTRWWSLTLYNGDHYLTPNPYNRYSVKGTQAIRQPDGKIRILLARDPMEGNWIPMGEGQNMSISIRMYNPDPGTENQLTALTLPTIRKIGDAS